MRGWLCLIALAGCAGEGFDGTDSPPGDDQPPAEIGDSPVTHEAGECAYNVALYGMTGNAGSTPVGPVTVDTTGIDICLSLDARDNLVIAHFAAGTVYETATASSFELALYDGDGTLMRDGWDVTFGSSPTTAFANLEYGIAKGQVVSAVLWVRAKAGTASSTVNLHLFEPYE